MITGLLSLEPSSTAHAGDAVHCSLSLLASVASVASPLVPVSSGALNSCTDILNILKAIDRTHGVQAEDSSVGKMEACV